MTTPRTSRMSGDTLVIDRATVSMLWGTLGMIGASFACTWLFNISGGSVLTAIVLHAGENAWTGSFLDMLVVSDHDLARAARQLAAVGVAAVLIVATKGYLGSHGATTATVTSAPPRARRP